MTVEIRVTVGCEIARAGERLHFHAREGQFLELAPVEDVKLEHLVEDVVRDHLRDATAVLVYAASLCPHERADPSLVIEPLAAWEGI